MTADQWGRERIVTVAAAALPADAPGEEGDFARGAATSAAAAPAE